MENPCVEQEIALYASHNCLKTEGRNWMTSGSVNAAVLRFFFSEEWEALDKTAVFRAGEASACVPLEGDRCAVPRQVLAQAGVNLEAGVYGTRGEELVLPTVWVNLGMILEGAAWEGEGPPGPAPGTGTADHRALSHRDAEDQHPIEAISGLEEITNLTLLKSWNAK